ncbi:MAG: DUF4349 domain-containing protein [Oscillospiraceae bacterium]|nr:DUF4349 domain-containing protein [Oscillospiraceae bacterium]
MKKKQVFALILALVTVLFALTGCGGSSKAPANNSIALRQESAAEAPMAAEPMAEMGSALADTTAGTGGSAQLPEARKWIITVDISAETDDLDALTAALDKTISAMGGFVEDQRVYNGSTYANRRYRNANMTVRIPAGDVDAFTEEVAGIANVVSREKNLEDITLRYVSTESRMKALQTEEARLLEFMEQAETMADLLEIEARLTDVRYELESVTSQLRLYDNQVDYATIYLSIEEVQEYTPVEEPTFFERITEGFSDSLEGLWEGLVNFVVWVITNSPYLVVYGLILAGIVVLGRKVRKLRIPRKRKNKDGEQK